MAGKTLSPAAVWLLVQIKKSWRGDDHNIELPFSAVSWKLTFKIFDKARHGLVEAGFIDIVNPGGRSPGGLNSAVYALSDRWRGEVSKRLADDPEAGYLKNVRLKSGGAMSVWYPAKKRRTSAENAAKARAAKARKQMVRAPRRKKRIKGRESKGKPKRQKQNLEEVVKSVRGRLKDSMAFIESRRLKE